MKVEGKNAKTRMFHVLKKRIKKKHLSRLWFYCSLFHFESGIHMQIYSVLILLDTSMPLYEYLSSLNGHWVSHQLSRVHTILFLLLQKGTCQAIISKSLTLERCQRSWQGNSETKWNLQQLKQDWRLIYQARYELQAMYDVLPQASCTLGSEENLSSCF